jgi:hypothetical protein
MFFSNGRTSPEGVLPKRRPHMQMELFPTARELCKRSSVVARLNQDERATLIRALARLIVKTIRPSRKGGSDE